MSSRKTIARATPCSLVGPSTSVPAAAAEWSRPQSWPNLVRHHRRSGATVHDHPIILSLLRSNRHRGISQPKASLVATASLVHQRSPQSQHGDTVGIGICVLRRRDDPASAAPASILAVWRWRPLIVASSPAFSAHRPPGPPRLRSIRLQRRPRMRALVAAGVAGPRRTLKHSSVVDVLDRRLAQLAE